MPNKQHARVNKPRRERAEATPDATAKTDTSTDFIIGRHPVEAALQSDQQINKVFIQEGLRADAIKEIEALAKDRHLIISQVPKQKLDLMTDGQNHQGVVLAIPPFAYATVDDLFARAEKANEAPFFLILDSIEDPHNLGSILRTADAAGVHGIIIPKRRAVGLTSVVAKTSTGAIEHVPVARVTNLVATAKELKDRGLWIFGTDMNGTDYRQWNAAGPTALVIGNEGKGISALLKKTVDEMLTIPMVGHVQSLNASVAASLLIYAGFNSRHPL
ncbi:23S rRNA (guanosine(2251)-2'-O)-methyltransferase RlmB [Furfurilactobacillus siliginis]|uniref:23S rRNA (Guanosine(2251)-2'-O)-methyltransferase RlmB n=1 Tax=Furfurilactobacillus siliginis TaxID=348151 RepID=A0A0R2KXS1_9LACO|nr:23S rRNA (guanosine(2251)-2'-O)-methyltransferase RlmB [Furfurilactobacillus siliginis]KRN94241.1 RNA methyltransferase [Furfurilactobacillus siliginis]GEK29363.1 23S rRNA (guanosine(2251)-2'-O)-methyltransferase RlmB [Furfurilactobacillus siliginis]